VTSKKGLKDFDENLKKAGAAIGQLLARSQAKLEKTGKQALKTTEMLVGAITLKSERPTEEITEKTPEPTIDVEERNENMSKQRLRPINNKPIAESIRILGDDIVDYLTDNGKTTAAELLMVMEKRRRNLAMIFGALGWLVAEKKIHVTRNGQNISLK